MTDMVRSRPWLIAVIVLWLGACSQTDNAAQEPDAHRVVGKGSAVTVRDGGDEVHARPFAEQYCAALGMSAHFTGASKHRHNRYAYSTDVDFVCIPQPSTQNQ